MEPWSPPVTVYSVCRIISRHALTHLTDSSGRCRGGPALASHCCLYIPPAKSKRYAPCSYAEDETSGCVKLLLRFIVRIEFACGRLVWPNMLSVFCPGILLVCKLTNWVRFSIPRINGLRFFN